MISGVKAVTIITCILVLAFDIQTCGATMWIEVTKRSGSAFPNPDEFTLEFEINYVNWRVRWSYVAVGPPFESLLLIEKDGELFVYSEGYVSKSGVRNVYNEVGRFNLSVLCVNMYEYTIIVEQDVDSAYARTIYIRADGSIEPTTVPISTVDKVTYTFIDNIYDWVIVVERDNIIIDGNGYTLQGTKTWSKGISLSGRTNVTVQNVQIKNFTHGIWLGLSRNISIIRSSIVNNSQGIFLWRSSGIWISENYIVNNYHGIIANNCSNNIISENKIVNHKETGIWLSFSSDNIVSGNTLEENNIGLSLAGALSNNHVYHNNFINNSRQFVPSKEYATVLDNGYPSGGNYWSDYKGVDVRSGLYQDKSGSDGIGDTPYVVNENNKDRYPLINPWGSGTPIASFSWSPPVPKENELITFDASSSLPVGGEIISYEWDFGDGNLASGKVITHKYTSAGNYTVTLTVTDGEGLSNTVQKQIEVKTSQTTEVFPVWVVGAVAAIAVIGSALVITLLRKKQKYMHD